MTELERLHKTWNTLAQDDPLWAVLTDESKAGRKWDLDSFLATGEEEIKRVFDYAGQHVAVDHDGEALDFGCGIGRLTRPIARRFARAYGIDISEEMIRTARSIEAAKCEFLVNREPGLAMFEDGKFAFIYSNITLQHMPQKFALRYIREFVRVLAPGGVLVFQVAERLCGGVLDRIRYHVRLRTRMRTLLGEEFMQVYFLPEQRVRHALQPLAVVDTQITNAHLRGFNGDLQFLSAPPAEGHLSRQYLAARHQ